MRIRRMTEDDLDAVVDIHMYAFRDHISSKLGKRYNRAFIGWFIKKECIHLVAIGDDEKVAAYYIAAPFGYQKAMNEYLFKIATVEMLKRPWVFFNKKILHTAWVRVRIILGLHTFIDTTKAKYPGKLMAMVGQGKSKDAVGKGMSVALMTAAHEESRKMGFDYARGTIYKTNIIARNILEKLGYIQEPEDASFTVVYYLNLK
ncbi:MAG: hypothetical protein ABI741_05305 [Ferruginibacter sp.]